MEIRWHRKAYAEFNELEKEFQQRVIDRINQVSKEPYHFLEGLKGTKFHKIRVGNYRIIVEWYRKENVLMILMIGKRNKIYKEMDKKLKK